VASDKKGCHIAWVGGMWHCLDHGDDFERFRDAHEHELVVIKSEKQGGGRE